MGFLVVLAFGVLDFDALYKLIKHFGGQFGFVGVSGGDGLLVFRKGF
ncbi:MAG: hypothetical protein FWH03_07375 [Firmicutes bacterium]|nr:hypothetical protein [Bacillota bacterium]